MGVPAWRHVALSTILWASCLGPGWAAQDGTFEQKAAQLFHQEYRFHAWDAGERTVAGEDWSLPPWVTAAPGSGVQINPRLVPDTFPGRILQVVKGSWRELEPQEGRYDFGRLREAITTASGKGRYAVRLSFGASVWETRHFAGLEDRRLLRTEIGTAPRWMADIQVPLIEEKPNRSIPFQVVNCDIYHSAYHERYLRLVAAFGRTGIPQMQELGFCYLHLSSASRGEEGHGPPVGDTRRRLFEERLAAWAEAFKGVVRKLCLVSDKEEDLALALKLGMGQRNGFVEHYMLHAPNPAIGQVLDRDGYLLVDEQSPLIAGNRASGDENEEYTREHEARFGPIETFPHRYHEATLRMLQMRRRFAWAEGGRWLIDPPLLHYLALELGRNVGDAPDAWCYLRESRVRQGGGQAVKNFERWLYQRDAEGARTEATERVDVPAQMFEYDPKHLYDMTARRTRVAQGQTEIRFAVDDAFLADGPHAVALKVTYLDRDDAVWSLAYATPSGKPAERRVSCSHTGMAKTVTFMLTDAVFPGRGMTGMDFRIRAVQGDAVIRLVRIIKLARNGNP